MSEGTWSLVPANGELRVLTGVAGRAAKMGHRLTIVMESWQAQVKWREGEPVAAELVVDVASLKVEDGQGGLTSLSAAEKSLARSNALKSLNAKKFPTIRFTAMDITRWHAGYRLSGTLEIGGNSGAQVVDVSVAAEGNSWAMAAEVRVSQASFGIKPYSMLMGSLKVADEVTVQFTGRHSELV